MLALPPLPERHVVLVAPGFAVSTADAYAWVAAERGSYTPMPALLRAEQLASWSALAALATNDFEAPVARRHPEITRIVGALRDAGARIALLSGSGSTVYGIFDEPPAPGVLARRMPGTVRSTRTLVGVPAVEILG